MIRRRQIVACDLAVGFRLDRHSTTRQDLYRSAEALLTLWKRELAGSPLTWVSASQKVPVPSDAGWDTLVTGIKVRIRRRGDATATAGHADAPHLLLTDDEIARELRWARRNRWHTGIEDLCGVVCDVLLPSAPGPWLPLTQAARSAGFRWLGVDRASCASLPPAPVSRFCHYSAADTLTAAAPQIGRRSVAEAFAAEVAVCAAALPSGRTMLLIDPGDAAALPAIVAALAILVGAGGRLLTLSDVPPDPNESSAGDDRTSRSRAEEAPAAVAGVAATANVGCSPASLARWRAAAALRPARLVERCDRLLGLLAGDGADATDAAITLEPSQRTLTASMPGQASLAGAGVEADFEDGRLCRLLFRGSGLAADSEPIRSYVTTAAGALSFQSVSAFALDGGLREVLALPAGAMTLAIDYLLAAAGALAIQVSVSCEAEPAGLQRVVPLALPLSPGAAADGSITATARWPRGEGRPVSLAPGLAAAGTSIELHTGATGGLVVTRLDGGGRDACLVRLESTLVPRRSGPGRRRGAAGRSSAEVQLMPSEDQAAGRFAGNSMVFAVAISDRALSVAELRQVRNEILEGAAAGSSRPE